ncbi:MAG TPA: hypothetical protein VFS25_23205, partial [Chitinophaga sp.]|uniref:hypothetical protein n=1 Tax=Chitinophaga sp. TaxID=1869181 RepID=UPI002DB87EE4
AHFSARDMETALITFEQQFASFSPESWTGLFTSIDTFVTAVKEKMKTYKTQDNDEREETATAIPQEEEVDTTEQPLKRRSTRIQENREKKRARSQSSFLDETKLRDKGFQNLKGNIADLLRPLEERVEELAEKRSRFNEKSLATEITRIAGEKWRLAWEQSKKDTAKRLELATKVKELRQFEKAVEPADVVMKAISAITQNTSVQTLLNRMVPVEYALLLINNGFAIPKIQSILELARAMHTHNIVIHLEEMFQNNEWLDIVLLQEVNDPTLLGKDKSPGAAASEAPEHPLYDAYHGPRLSSGGENPQREHYPLLIKKTSGLTVTHIYQVKTTGEMVDAGAAIDWNKNVGIFRPVIVYEVQRKNQGKPFWIGVVHTTPEPDSRGEVAEWNRQNIYKEVEEGLTTLRKRAAAQGIPLIVGGDYYLTAEAVVKQPDPHNRSGDPEIPGIKGKITELQRKLQEDLQALANKEDQESLQKAEVLRERLKFLEQAQRDEQLHRNIEDLTVKSQVEDIGLLIAQTVSGTNPKHDPLTRQIDVQIADFFIHNQAWQSVVTGILRPEGKILQVDAEDLSYSKYWQRFSDHFPVAAIFSLNDEDLTAHPALVTPSGSEEAAAEVNTARFAGYALQEKRLAWLNGLIGRHVDPLDLPNWCKMVVGIAKFILDELDKKTKYDFSVPDNVFDCLKKINFLGKRVAEVMSSVELQTLKPEQIRKLAMDYVHNRYQALLKQALVKGDHMESFDFTTPTTMHEYTQKILQLENNLSLEESERLHITTPQDFQPAYSTEALVKKLASYIIKPRSSSLAFTISGSAFDRSAPRTVQIGSATWTINNTGGAGNCFYNAIYEALNGVRSDPDAQQSVRAAAVHAMLTNQQVITHLFGAVPDIQALNAVIDQIIQPGNWTEDFTPSFVAEALNLEIVVLRSNGTVYYEAGPTHAGNGTRRIYLCYNGVHFDSITGMAL